MARNNYPRNNNRNQNQNNSNDTIYKRSGFEFRAIERNGLQTFICWGWKKNSHGLFKLYARPYKGTNVHVSKNQNRFHNLFVTIVNTATGEQVKTSGLFNETSKKLIMKEIGWIGSPNSSGQYKTASGKVSKGTLTRIVK